MTFVNKRICFIVILVGIVLILLSVILAVVKTSNTNIIGGADLPTFLNYYRSYMWLAEVGSVAILFSALSFGKKR